jgi:hypothetical protein
LNAFAAKPFWLLAVLVSLIQAHQQGFSIDSFSVMSNGEVLGRR